MAVQEAVRPLRRNRNWSLLFTGQAVSALGNTVFDITLVLWVATDVAAGQRWAPAAVSGVLLAAAVPVLLIGPVAGVFVDRWDWRRTMLAADLVRACLVAALTVVALEDHRLSAGLRLAAIYVVVAACSAAAQFFGPARFAMIGAVVAAPQRPRAFSLAEAAGNTATVAGPPLAAPLLFAAGVQWALVINAASFVVSFATILAIRDLPAAGPRPAGAADPAASGSAGGSAGRRFRADLGQGLRFFAGNRMLLLVGGALFVYTLGVGAINALDVFFVRDNLHVAASWLGTLSGAFGVGAVLGALLAGPAAARFRPAVLFAVGLSLVGLIIAVYSRMTVLPAGIVLLGLAGVPVGAVSATSGPLIFKATPADLIGRVSAVLNPLMHLAAVLSMAVAGILASTVLVHLHASVAGLVFGPIDTIFGVCALLMLASGICVLRPLARADQATPVGPPELP